MSVSPPYNGGGRKYFLVGGAGFLGSHFADALLSNESVAAVTVYDNLSSGREWHFHHHLESPRFRFVQGEAADLALLSHEMAGHDVVLHLASNPEIARAASDPEIDFRQGTALTSNVLEAMRRSGVSRLLYASGSGVYGDTGPRSVSEEQGPWLPVSTYGASKLAGEAMVSAYCSMFGMTACAFRFANVVGARQTHGVGFDFVRKLRENPRLLRILGNGRQSKHYIHVSDVVDAVLCVEERCHEAFSVFNVATQDAITVTEIAHLAVQCLKLDAMPEFEYSGGDRGWKGDVPVVRLNTEKIQRLGWSPRFTSYEAMQRSLLEILKEERLCYA
ncbi:MAG: NAD-dependent epimerase/dehydratase family protein [Bacillota bacterium]|nr:NAD-dependent epimerase/dehydratase family protein [Bacillota bacterium]